jgi:hypothetical protein
MLASCGAPSNSSAPQAPQADISYSYGAYDGAAESSVSYEYKREAKRVKSADVEMETDDFDSAAEAIKAEAVNAGGYVQNFNSFSENSEMGLTSGNITLRVPAEAYDGVLDRIMDLAKKTRLSQREDDVSDEYYDALTRVETLQAEEDRLAAIIGETSDIDELIALNERISEIRRRLESHRARANNLDRLSSFATINVSLRETESAGKLVPVFEDLGSRMRSGFAASFSGAARFLAELLVFAAGAFVPLALIGLIAFGIAFFMKKARAKRSRPDAPIDKHGALKQ